MDTLHCFTLETTSDHVAHLVLNRPEAMNTMHPAFWRELDAVLTTLHREGKARALVISSTGKHFSAGMALETFGGAITMDDRSPEGRAPGWRGGAPSRRCTQASCGAQTRGLGRRGGVTRRRCAQASGGACTRSGTCARTGARPGGVDPGGVRRTTGIAGGAEHAAAVVRAPAARRERSAGSTGDATGQGRSGSRCE